MIGAACIHNNTDNQVVTWRKRIFRVLILPLWENLAGRDCRAVMGKPGRISRICTVQDVNSVPVWGPGDGYHGHMPAAVPPRLLLSIIELGGYPNFTPLYEALGYEVAIETRMRKAISFLKQRKPDVIVAEFNFQSDFRDRTSSLESLLAVVQRLPATRVVVFYEREYTPQFDRLRARLPVHAAIAFPVDADTLREILLQQHVDGSN